MYVHIIFITEISVCVYTHTTKKIERELSSFASYSICSRREESAYSCIWTYAYRWCILSYSSFLLLQHTRMLIAVGVHIEKKSKLEWSYLDNGWINEEFLLFVFSIDWTQMCMFICTSTQQEKVVLCFLLLLPPFYFIFEFIPTWEKRMKKDYWTGVYIIFY